MMVLSGKYQLQSTGALLLDGVAPTCGELSAGVNSVGNGRNLTGISVETVRDIFRIRMYAEGKYFAFNPVRTQASLFDQWNKFDEYSWNKRAIEILQLKQWDENALKQLISPYRQHWLELIENERVKQEKPLKQLIAIIDHEFTVDEKKFIEQVQAKTLSSDVEMPESLQSVFSCVSEIPIWGYDSEKRSCRKDSLCHHLPQYYRKGFWKWADLIHQVFKVKLLGEEEYRLNEYNELPWRRQHRIEDFPLMCLTEEVKPLFEQHLTNIEIGYRRIVSAVASDAPPKIQIPLDDAIRSLMTHPIPLIFASTVVRPSPSDSSENPEEYLVNRPVALGRDGCNILFTDTSESREKLAALLPEHLKGEVEIHLFEGLDVGKIPLIHAPSQVEIIKE